jgi:hypothetical protein
MVVHYRSVGRASPLAVPHEVDVSTTRSGCQYHTYQTPNHNAAGSGSPLVLTLGSRRCVKPARPLSVSATGSALVYERGSTKLPHRTPLYTKGDAS